MTQPGDAKGDYRGLAHRNAADLKAWLAKRPTERRWSLICRSSTRIIHFWDTPQRGQYSCPDLLDDIGGGHNIVSTVFL